MRQSRRLVASVGLLSLLAFFTACAQSAPPLKTVDLAAASYASLTDVARASEYLVEAEVVGDPAEAKSGADDALVYLVSEVRVTEVLASRPDARRKVAPGEVVRAGASLLKTADDARAANYDDLAEEFPQADQALEAENRVLLFMVAADSPDTDFDLVGYGALSGDNVTLRALPGPVAGRVFAEADVVSAFEKELASPAPWRAGKEAPVATIPEEGPSESGPTRPTWDGVVGCS